jgi:predicted amidohydrolase YtcJ
MSTELLEEKVAELAKRVAALETKVEHAPKGGWQDIIGWEKDDELFREAVRLGAEWRAKANAEGR